MVGKLVIKDVRNVLLITLLVMCVIQVVLCGKHFIEQLAIAMNYRTMHSYIEAQSIILCINWPL